MESAFFIRSNLLPASPSFWSRHKERYWRTSASHLFTNNSKTMLLVLTTHAQKSTRGVFSVWKPAKNGTSLRQSPRRWSLSRQFPPWTHFSLCPRMIERVAAQKALWDCFIAVLAVWTENIEVGSTVLGHIHSKFYSRILFSMSLDYFASFTLSAFRKTTYILLYNSV